jgi:hypothetical protein
LLLAKRIFNNAAFLFARKYGQITPYQFYQVNFKKFVALEKIKFLLRRRARIGPSRRRVRRHELKNKIGAGCLSITS